MLAVSVEWPKLGPRVFTRIEQQAAAASGDNELALLVRTRPRRHALSSMLLTRAHRAETAAYAGRG
jgi:hypothetical protein